MNVMKTAKKPLRVVAGLARNIVDKAVLQLKVKIELKYKHGQSHLTKSRRQLAVGSALVELVALEWVFHLVRKYYF